MKLKILLPEKILLEKEVESVVAEAEDGSLGLRRGHVDFVTALVPGIISFRGSEGEEEFAATDRGILLKHGDRVLISVHSGVAGKKLGLLQEAVDDFIKRRRKFAEKSRHALGLLEADFLRRYVEME